MNYQILVTSYMRSEYLQQYCIDLMQINGYNYTIKITDAGNVCIKIKIPALYFLQDLVKEIILTGIQSMSINELKE